MSERRVFTGEPASAGIAAGKIHLLQNTKTTAHHSTAAADVLEEEKRFQEAVDTAHRQIQELLKRDMS
ncbi:MAG: hypothetical protein HY042_04475, partial [Spirochaetia bacterium]|nr:hypothetical protein [Spirochaetia bacterium]